MNAQRDMVKIDGLYLKSLIRQSDKQIQDADSSFGISRQRLSTCFKSGIINRKVLYKIAQEIKLTKTQFDEVLGIKPLPVFFRKERLEEPHIEEIEKIRLIAGSFLKLFPQNISREFVLPVFKNLPPNEMAVQIRKQLSIISRSVSMEDVIDTLVEFGVFVYFYPFQLLGINTDPKSKKMLRAAAVPFNDNNWLILLDTSKSKEDVFFDLIHELTHIFAGHDGNEKHNKAIEDYCQEVAKEFFTPMSYFQKQHEPLLNFFNNIRVKAQAVGKVEQLRLELGASFEGVVLRLIEAKIISGELSGYLYAVINNKKRNREVLNSFFKGDWFNQIDLDEYRYYYKFFIQIRNLYLEGQLTLRGVAVFLNIEFGEAHKICSGWESEFAEVGAKN